MNCSMHKRTLTMFLHITIERKEREAYLWFMNKNAPFFSGGAGSCDALLVRPPHPETELLVGLVLPTTQLLTKHQRQTQTGQSQIGTLPLRIWSFKVPTVPRTYSTKTNICKFGRFLEHIAIFIIDHILTPTVLRSITYCRILGPTPKG